MMLLASCQVELIIATEDPENPFPTLPAGLTPEAICGNGGEMYLYGKGKRVQYSDDMPGVLAVCEEVVGLLERADDSYHLIVTSDTAKTARKGDAVELIFRDIQSSSVALNGQPIYYLGLLVPLSGDLLDGTVLVNGLYQVELPDQKVAYEIISKGWQAVINSEGTERLRELLAALPEP